MTGIVKAGSRGVDVSFARPPGPRLVELGYDFLVGYLSVPPSSAKKNLTKAECFNYLLYVALLFVWEMTASRANLGAAYGTIDGTNAKREALLRDCPTDVPILVADDTNTTTTNISAQEAYMRAFAAACAPYPIGIYGDVDILYRCADLWQIGWLPNAWSWSGGSKAIAEATAKALGVHVLQRTGFYIDGTWAVDPNEVIRDFPAWSNLTPQTGDDMKLYHNSQDRVMPYGLDQAGHVKFLIDTWKRNIGPNEYVDGGWNLVASIGMSNADLDAIPDAGASTGIVDQVARDLAESAAAATQRNANAISDIRIGGQRIADAGGM